MNAQLTELIRLITNLIRTGTILEVDTDTPTFEYADTTLEEYRNEPKETRPDIVKGYVGFKGVPASPADAFMPV